jgi:hypothetical protein
METKDCKCGNAHMTYEQIAEDYWHAVSYNTTLEKRKYDTKCICNNCGEMYDSFDDGCVDCCDALDLDNEFTPDESDLEEAERQVRVNKLLAEE